MSVPLAFLVVAAAVAVMAALMLLVRRRSPAGGFFTDSDRAAGVFNFVGTAFAVLLAFMILLTFESFGNAKDSASREAVAVSQAFRTARLFAPEGRDDIQGELICYARAVIHDEWPAMRRGHESPLVLGWIADIERTIDGIDVRGAKQAVAYDHWFEQMAERREGRRGRLAEASPLVPPLVWVALLLGGAVILVYMCFYADRRESAVVQTMMMAAVVTMVASGLLTVRFLDRPYDDRSGAIAPAAMVRSLQVMERERAELRPTEPVPCDDHGRRRL
jgi:multisubunit Na+/H+ antiporter MnhB subunit